MATVDEVIEKIRAAGHGDPQVAREGDRVTFMDVKTGETLFVLNEAPPTPRYATVSAIDAAKVRG